MKLFLLDAYALIYRSYYAFIKNPRVNSKGQNTSAIFGFVNTLEEFHEDKSTWFEKRLHTDAYSRVIDDKQLMAKVKELENTFVALLLFDVDYQVEMPSGNQPKVEVHRLTGTRLIAADVQLESTSVRRHTLAYAFTLFLLLGAIAGVWILHHKRKRL